MSCDSRLLALRRLLIASSLFLGLSESIEQSSNYYCSALVDWLSPMAGNDMYGHVLLVSLLNQRWELYCDCEAGGENINLNHVPAPIPPQYICHSIFDCRERTERK